MSSASLNNPASNRPGRILTVCTANVCRSPLAMLSLRDGLDDPAVEVHSCGLAPQGDAICSRVQRLRTDAWWQDHAAAHEPTSISTDAIDGAHLILVASVGIRGEVAKIAPKARHRTFTLREAAWLGDTYLPSSLTGADTLEAYASYLDRQRRVADVIPRSKRVLPLRKPQSPMSIIDGHGLRDGAHRATLRQVVAAARSVANHLRFPETENPNTESRVQRRYSSS